MPSPLPGMDPYLEGGLWTTFHFAFGAELLRHIAPRLRPRYLALPVERLVMEEPDDIAITALNLYPDVSVLRVPPVLVDQQTLSTFTAPLQLATVMPQAVPHVSIEIRDVAQRQLVTAIEILSPTNKRGEGRTEYLAKRRRILLSTAHLLEFDLLREGSRVPMQEPLPSAPYFIFVSRAERRPLTDVWPIALDTALPNIPLPLLPGDADLLIDVQAVFTATYELASYDLALNYREQPEVALNEQQAAWLDQHLREQGLRS
jgi:hypothetical protein